VTLLAHRTLTLAAGLACALLLIACSGETPAFEQESDRAKGSPDAPVTIIEYASTACGACALFHEQGYAAIEDGVDDGDVRFVLREMLTGQPNIAMAGFMLARCAPEDQYFDVIDLLFEQQRALFSALQQGNARGQFQLIARSAGFSDEKFNTCMNNQDIADEIQNASAQAIAAGIGFTPSFIINGQQLERQVMDGAEVYTVNGAPLEDEQGAIPAQPDRDTWDRIVALFKSRAEG